MEQRIITSSSGSLKSARGTPLGQRELSPVRWGNDEAGVYLGRSGWVQVHQQQSSTFTQQKVRVRHSPNEPPKRRPDSLSLRGPSPLVRTPSPLYFPEDALPPPITPIISPPPAFQDVQPIRHRQAYLSRSKEVIDSDSPPPSPAPRSRPYPRKHFIHRGFTSSSDLVHRYSGGSSSDDETYYKRISHREIISPKRVSSDSSSIASSISDGDSRHPHVRRSRSLQLPEAVPPTTSRRHLTRKTLSEDSKKRSRVPPDAAMEAKIVAQFVSRVRSQKAARELLLSRILERQDPKAERIVAGRESFNVCVVNDNHYRRTLPSSVENFSLSIDNGSPCNPSTCDFWPQCSHQPYRLREDVPSHDKGYLKWNRRNRHTRYSDRRSEKSVTPESEKNVFVNSPQARMTPPAGPVREELVVGAAPSCGWGHLRSLSLPKCYRSATKPIHLSRKHAKDNGLLEPVTMKTAPVTPVKERERNELVAGYSTGGSPSTNSRKFTSNSSIVRKDSISRPMARSSSQPSLRGSGPDEISDGSSHLSVTSDVSGRKEAAIAEALWDHVAMDGDELAFRAGDLIEVCDTSDPQWWWGCAASRIGRFPSSFVRLRVSQEDTVEDCLAAMAAGSRAAAHLCRTSVSLLSNDEVRCFVVQELLTTERDFVQGLRDVAEGYIHECRRRLDLFTIQQIQTIFGNLEHILNFQQMFLHELEERVDSQAPYRACLGEVFLRHQSGFGSYSEYCNNYPTAIAALQQMYQSQLYTTFFEGCRIMRGLMEIPLDGYLLTPVQRICKYPLQLAELAKYTKQDHDDFEPVKEALLAMQKVASQVNEQKRRMENMEKIATWQAQVEAWEGDHVLELSTQLLYQEEVMRVTSTIWTSQISLFLFDHQIVYCKKDLLRAHLIYKGRICLDTSEIINVPDGKESSLGVSVRHAIKIHSLIQDKWLLFCCRSSQAKARWLAAFAAERQLIQTDRQDGLELTSAARHIAKAHAIIQSDKGKMKRDVEEKEGSKKVGAWFNWSARKQQTVT